MDSQLVSLAESIAKELPAIYLPRNKQAPLGFSWTTFFFTMISMSLIVTTSLGWIVS